MKKGWVPTRSALEHVLTWLDEGVDSGGEKYLEMRRRLVSYFDRKRCLSPDELADETLNRVARRLEEEGAITDAPARYCYIVAKYVLNLEGAQYWSTVWQSLEWNDVTQGLLKPFVFSFAISLVDVSQRAQSNPHRHHHRAMTSEQRVSIYARHVT